MTFLQTHKFIPWKYKHNILIMQEKIISIFIFFSFFLPHLFLFYLIFTLNLPVWKVWGSFWILFSIIKSRTNVSYIHISLLKFKLMLPKRDFVILLLELMMSYQWSMMGSVEQYVILSLFLYGKLPSIKSVLCVSELYFPYQYTAHTYSTCCFPYFCLFNRAFKNSFDKACIYSQGIPHRVPTGKDENSCCE